MAVMIVGLGRLGTRTAQLLDEELVLVDYDIVQEDNLGQQPLYTEEDVGQQKAVVAAARLSAVARAVPFTKDTRLDGVDCIVDATDSLHARLVINDLARKHGVPAVFGTAADDRGLAFTGCWQCIVGGKTATDDCSSDIRQETLDILADVQARMVRAVLDGRPERELVRIKGAATERVAVGRNPGCRACSGEYVHIDAPFEVRFCPGTRKLQARPNAPRAVDLDALDGEEYDSARRVRLGNGTALVHRHGLIEFSGVGEDEARRFAEETLGERPV